MKQSRFRSIRRRLLGVAAFGLAAVSMASQAQPRTRTSVPPHRASQSLPIAVWQAILDAGATYHLDANFLAAVIKQESGFNTLALSNKGAMGMMQLMPETAWALRVRNPFDPRENIFAGTYYLSGLIDRYHGNASLALAAYNAGAGKVDRYRGIPPYRETQNYVAQITYLYQTHKLHDLQALSSQITETVPPSNAPQARPEHKEKRIRERFLEPAALESSIAETLR